MSKTKELKEDKSVFFKINKSFDHNFMSLKVFVKHLSPVVAKRDKKIRTDIQKAVESAFKRIKKITSKKVSAKLDKNFIANLLTQLDKEINVQNTQLLYNSSFTMLVSYVDYLVYDLMHYYYEKFPQAFGSKQLNALTLEDLLLCGSMKELIDNVINMEIDSILNKNFDSHIKYLNDNLKISLPQEYINWPKVKEVIERRHLIVHNSCKVTDRYLNYLKQNKTIGGEQLKRGDDIKITREYFNQSFEELYLLCSILIQLCWRKWESNSKTADHVLTNENIYFFLKQENWSAAERLCKFASDNLNIADEQSRNIVKIDYLLALKFQKKIKELSIEAKKFDASSLKPVFQMAIAVLQDNHKLCFEKMKDAVAVSEISKKEFDDWPLFNTLRKNRLFRSKAYSILKLKINDKASGGKKTRRRPRRRGKRYHLKS